MKKETDSSKDQEYVNKNSNIDISDIQGLEKFASCLIVICIISIILSVVLNIVTLNISGIITGIITGICSIAVIAVLTSIIVSVGCAAKKNQETLNKLIEALDDSSNSTLKKLKTQIAEENAEENNAPEYSDLKNIYQLPPNKQLCPICYSVFDKNAQICPNCGYDTKNPQQMKRYLSSVASKDECPCCFAKISPNDTECPNCGYKLKKK